MVGTIGSEMLEEALRDIGKGDARLAAKGIGLAAGIECESIEFYKKQAEKFRGTETGDFFSFLEKQEKAHLEAITALKESLEKEGKWIDPKLPAGERPEIFAKKDWDKENKDGLQAVLFALWKEKQAQEFYQGIAAKAGNKGAEHFFTALAEFEKGHAQMLEEYVDESYYSRELIMG
jgi:rubrerythrin